MRIGLQVAGIAVVGLMASGAARAAAPVQCAALKSVSVDATTITSAEVVAAGAFKAPGPAMGPPADYTALPAFCRVAGSIRPTADSDIRFELWLPESGWNGKFVQTGNGGAAGSIVHNSLAEVLARGYAVANTDTGHQGGGGDFAWAVGHPEKVTDYAWRSFHLLTGVGKAITGARYGRAADKAYWYGCSTGGRQGLKEAQRFADDYDGIVAGAPASNWAPLMSLSIEIQRNLTGPKGLGVDKLGLLHEAALAACDATDGVKDRVIGDPAQCHFDPAVLACKAGETQGCLSASEVDAARRIYRGVVDHAGHERMPGTGPGSEMLWAAYASPQFSIGTSFFRNVVKHDPAWDPMTFDVERDLKAAEQADAGAAAAMNPDITRFVARGGKLLTYHGTADGLIPYRNSVNYYDSVVAKLGRARAQESTRLYLVPGMSHCSGGEGASEVDWLGALDRWVTTGRAPEALPARHSAAVPGMPGAPAVADAPFTRPVCVYPKVARYTGSGDPADAANFRCAAP